MHPGADTGGRPECREEAQAPYRWHLPVPHTSQTLPPSGLRRCARCNGDFIPEPMPAALLPAGHDVPPGILEQHHEFWVCARCSGVYWQGNQYRRAKTAVTELIAKMALA